MRKYQKNSIPPQISFRLSSNKSGFTLIELLVVIAVLGILAAVLLVGVNPLEQIARARDAGRISAVAQLGRAMERYGTITLSGAYPAASTTWQDTLVTAGEIKSVATVPATSFGTCGSSNGEEGHVCYQVGTSGYCPNTVAISVWTYLESQSYTNKLGCSPPTNYPQVVYQSGVGKVRYGCSFVGSAQDVCYPLTSL